MKIEIECPHCAQRYSVGEENAGKQVSCKACGKVFRLPEAASQPETPESYPMAELLDDYEPPSQPAPSPPPAMPNFPSTSSPAAGLGSKPRRKSPKNKPKKGWTLEAIGSGLTMWAFVGSVMQGPPTGPYTWTLNFILVITGLTLLLLGAVRRKNPLAMIVAGSGLVFVVGVYIVVPSPKRKPPKQTAAEKREAERDQRSAIAEEWLKRSDERSAATHREMQEHMGLPSHSKPASSPAASDSPSATGSAREEELSGRPPGLPELPTGRGRTEPPSFPSGMGSSRGLSGSESVGPRSRGGSSPIPSRRRSSRAAGRSADSNLVGGTGGGEFRMVSPTGEPVVGVAYSLGSWAGEGAVGRLEPLFNRDETKPTLETEVARDGYVLAAFEVDADKYVNALRPLFAKVKADGSLDSADYYKGNWIGTPTGRATRTVGGGGAKVVGIVCRRAAILDAVGVVSEEE